MKVKFYIFAVVVMLMSAVLSGCKKEEIEPEWSVTTDSASDILQSSAKLQGSFTNNEIEVTEKGFFYDTAREMYNQKKIVASNRFSIELSDLTPSTTYYYYAYATAYSKTKQGEIKMFRTLDITAPNVQTLEPTSISKSSATLNGNVTSDGGATVTARGFVYGTSASNLSQNVQSGTGTGSFTKALTGLSHSTTYYYKAYATNAIGTNYGEVKQFTTSSPSMPTVQTNAATSISMTGATLNGNVTADGGATVTVRGFVYGTSASNLSQNVQSGTGTGSFTKALTGLSSSTTYYYKAYATNSEGTAYGDVMSFTPTYSFSYDFESCTAWSVDNFSPCSTYDGDGLVTGGIQGVSFTNSGYKGSYIAFQNGTANGFTAHGGTKFGCCMYATNGANNDWFITPALIINNGTTFSFWARSANNTYGLEQFRVAVSNDYYNYTYIAGSSSSSISAPTEWTQYTYDLSAYAGQTMYIAIMCVSNDVFALCIDDIYVGTNLNGKNMETDDRAELKQDSKSNIKKSSK